MAIEHDLSAAKSSFLRYWNNVHPVEGFYKDVKNGEQELTVLNMSEYMKKYQTRYEKNGFDCGKFYKKYAKVSPRFVADLQFLMDQTAAASAVTHVKMGLSETPKAVQQLAFNTAFTYWKAGFQKGMLSASIALAGLGLTFLATQWGKGAAQKQDRA